MGVACSHCVIQHSLSSFSDESGGVSGPKYSGSRSTSGDTGEGELVRAICQVPRYRNVPYNNTIRSANYYIPMISTSVYTLLTNSVCSGYALKKGEFLLLYLVSMECPSELQN